MLHHLETTKKQLIGRQLNGKLPLDYYGTDPCIPPMELREILSRVGNDSELLMCDCGENEMQRIREFAASNAPKNGN